MREIWSKLLGDIWDDDFCINGCMSDNVNKFLIIELLFYNNID